MEQIIADHTGASNKEKILYTAIELFSQGGYSNVSMRKIAEVVGIKAASIYNHYKNKEAILEEIMHFFQHQLHEQVYPAFEMSDSLDIEEFIQKLTMSTETFFLDSTYAKIASIILREQFQNESIRKMLLEELIVYPRKVISAYFERLIRAGKMLDLDPVLAAKEFHAFYIYEFYENSLSRQIDNQDDKRSQLERVEHIRLFLQTWIIDKTSLKF